MVASRNPYHRDDGSRVVVRSVVAMLDILGFAEMAKKLGVLGPKTSFSPACIRRSKKDASTGWSMISGWNLMERDL
jgi:hypothetical protein